MSIDNQENNLPKDLENSSEIVISQEEIDRELDSQAMRVDESPEQYRKDREERLEATKQERAREDEKEIKETRESIEEVKEGSGSEMSQAEETCKKDLEEQLDSSTNWASVEGRIAAMLGEIGEGKKQERSEKGYEIISQVAQHITNWLKENKETGEYDNGILASEAVKHAVNQMVKSFSALEGKGSDDEKSGDGELKNTKEGIKRKTIEMDKRIRAKMAKDPYDHTLKADFRLFRIFAQQDWTEDFDVEKL